MKYYFICVENVKNKEDDRCVKLMKYQDVSILVELVKPPLLDISLVFIYIHESCPLA